MKDARSLSFIDEWDRHVGRNSRDATETALHTGPPVVTLRSASARPYDGAIAAARTCYSPRVIGAEEVTPGQRESIGPLTFEAGHHTVYQHAHFEFGLENVSRQFVWSFLHSHPFYNSEQSSQRFVRLDQVAAHVPEGLTGAARTGLRGRGDGRPGSRTARWPRILKEDTYANHGRPPQPLAAGVGEAAEQGGAGGGEEGHRARALRDPRRRLHLHGPHRLRHRPPPPVPDDAHRRHPGGERPRRHRDGRQGARPRSRLLREGRRRPAGGRRRGGGALAGGRAATATPRRPASTRCSGARAALLVDHSARAQETTADAVRAVFGLSPSALSDAEALERLLNPSLNRYRLETLNLAVHSPLGRAMHHASYTFLKRLSHTADSQDQRHRMVPASRPLMTLGDTVRPDYVTPAAHRGQRARPGHLRRGDGAGLGGEEPPARHGRARWSRRCTSSPTRSPCASTRAGASSTSPTSG